MRFNGVADWQRQQTTWIVAHDANHLVAAAPVAAVQSGWPGLQCGRLKIAGVECAHGAQDESVIFATYYIAYKSIN